MASRSPPRRTSPTSSSPARCRCRLKLISRSQVSATLGKTALDQGLVAGLVGFAVVCMFLLVFYRMLGLVAVGGLVVYGAYFFALIKLIPVTLTLPGIAGLILTIGVAADANVVIFERVKEEIRAGRSSRGIAAGYQRGFARSSTRTSSRS